MSKFRSGTLFALLALSTACASHRQGPVGPPPSDPIASVEAAELRSQGLGFARRGDLVRAQQYLSAARQKGFDERVVVPELVKVCIAASRLRAALAFAEPYLRRHPGDAGMQYVVGTIHMALGNLHEASNHLSGALFAGHLMTDAAFSLALVAEERGQPELVRAHLQEYLAESPRGRYALRARSMLLSLGADS
ncbi:MAG: hypothetical protein GY811_15975 [Myxococcales bacterium]|nr:hypothetical protein [Myxococcales bacterium]